LPPCRGWSRPNSPRPRPETRVTARPLWLLRRVTDLPSSHGWLGPNERDYLDSLEVSRRRTDWLLGRWVARQAVVAAAAVQDARQLEIVKADDGAPEVTVAGVRAPVSLSLSHRSGHALCGLVTSGRIGCDLELVEARSRTFVEDYFTSAEKASIGAAGEQGMSVAANALWSAKESVLKLLRLGLSVDSRSVEVIAGSGAVPTPRWQRFDARSIESGSRYHGWWCRRGELILTLATELETGPPLRLSAADEEG
jgi:4'-phosphopantetheinyl transferase